MHIIDSAAGVVIRVGGVAVIVAILGIIVYLAAVVAPLFGAASLGDRTAGQFEKQATSEPLFTDLDEYLTQYAWVTSDGVLHAQALQGGERLADRRIVPEGREITAASRAPRGGAMALGFDDGAVQLGTVQFRTRFIHDEPEELQGLQPGERAAHEGGVVERTPIGQLRLTEVVADLTDPTDLPDGEGAVVAMHYRAGTGRNFVLAVREDGTANLSEVRIIRPLTGGAPRVRAQNASFRIEAPGESVTVPDWVFVSESGLSAYAIWQSGVAQRYAIADRNNISLAETRRVVDEGERITAAKVLLGSETILLGDSEGALTAWFAARDQTAPTPDRLRMVAAHRFPPLGSPVTSIGVSPRNRLAAYGTAEGRIAVRHITSEKSLVDRDADLPGGVAHALLGPKDDAVLAVSPTGEFAVWPMHAAHPEASLKSLFGKVWYEGEANPEYVWQSSSGDDASEVKLTITPLIFGTLKATLYAMLFAVPLGVLAAIYTSEFLHPRVRMTVKPAVEIMASLPSVVLGFIAGLVIAPAAATIVPAILLALFIIPMAGLFAGYLWQLVPVRYAGRLRGWPRLFTNIGVVIAASLVALSLGPAVERALFTPSEQDALALMGLVEPVPIEQTPEWVRGRENISADMARRLRAEGLYFESGRVVRAAGSLDDPETRALAQERGVLEPSIVQWLNGVFGGPFPGWVLLAFPASAILVSLLKSRFLDPRIRDWEATRSPGASALLELGKLACVLAASFLIALGVAWLLTLAKIDPRDSVFGPFTPRNSLIVGIAMGFAVIPIIYTISEDALSAVPNSLRSASLGAGATAWQTAVRVVLPVAMPGIFSACMIGLGRAVGETMIVLMATGNTPIMEWNMFSGFRTLSANIAVELPEAPKDDTHYRVLFLCGLVLLVMTSVLNTGAEIVRQRFRKRSAAL